MASRRTSTHRGFTLIEILVVLLMMGTIAGFALFMSMESYKGSGFRSDRDLLVSLLEHARAEAVNNICAGTCTDGATHGVHIDGTAHTYTVFQGATYASRDTSQDQTFSENQTVTPTGFSDVIFTQLTGGTSSPATITLSGSGKTSVISVDTSGRISWTN